MILLALKNRVNVYDAFIEGGETGLKTVISIYPALLAILSLTAMLRASGVIDALTQVLSPITTYLDIPAEILPLALIRPFSGGASIGLLTDIVVTYGPDSPISKMACILCASTETTFYTLMVYFKKTRVKYTKRVVLAAIFGDLVGILCASRLS